MEAIRCELGISGDSSAADTSRFSQGNLRRSTTCPLRLSTNTLSSPQTPAHAKMIAHLVSCTPPRTGLSQHLWMGIVELGTWKKCTSANGPAGALFTEIWTNKDLKVLFDQAP